MLSCHFDCDDLMEPCVCEHQESRIGKAVEVMIQHVENLRRMYTKEHAELLELRETLMQNERSFGSQTERGMTCKLQCFFFRELELMKCFGNGRGTLEIQ